MTTYIRTIFCFLLLISAAFAGDDQLIKDMESLRDSLPFKDPGRPTLTRRLADLCFEKAVKDDKDLILTGKGNASEVSSLRTKAIKYYTEALDGEKGTYPVATGELKYKIEFQIARLNRMQGKRAEALNTFNTLAAIPNLSRDLMRETLLTIAEMYDEDGKWEKTQEAYIKALPLAQGPDAISYIHYRLGWAYFRKDQLAQAQTEMALALYDSQGNLKDQAMNDYIQFLAAKVGDNGSEALSKIEVISTKARRPEYVESLAEAYLSAGNREAGVLVMAHIQRQRPNAIWAARLSEEYYGFKRFDEMKEMLGYLQKQTAQVTALDKKKHDLVDQILRRLVVQLDGQRKSNPGAFAQEVMQVIDTHLALFPQSDVVFKMRSGWLTANTDEVAKMDRLAQWIATEKDATEVRRYRQERAALAVKQKNYTVLRAEALELAKATAEADQREWTYVEAKAALDMGEDNYALGVFQKLAQKTASPDKWAVQSQHLALDILNKQKRFQDLAAQAATWTAVAALQNSAFKADVTEMQKAQQEASFEYAASLGETPAALAEFNRFCQNDQFTDKSCPNAKVLAVKLKDQAVLVQVLEKQKDQTALAAEYERMGRFVDAAKILESRMVNTQPEVEWIKISVLYQIGGDEASRTRVLRKLATRLKGMKSMSAELEGMSLAAFRHSEIKDIELLPLPWSAGQKIRMAADLESMGAGNAVTKKMVLSSKEDLGSVWAQNVFDRLHALDVKQRKVTFYGANSRSRFQQRLNLLGQYAKEVKGVLQGASSPVRIVLLNDVARAYSDLDQEILATPLPEGLSDEQIAGAKEAMEQLASPLRAEGEGYAKLAGEQVAAFAEASQWQTAMNEGAAAVVAQMQSQEKASREVASVTTDEAVRTNALKELSTNPESRSALEALKNDFTAHGDAAAAAYFTGRLTALEQL